MFIELVDVLRCPNRHEESWLVLSATRMVERHVVEGDLGCHVCRAHYPIRNGVARFIEPPGAVTTARPAEPQSDAVLRLAALLGLSEPGGLVLLFGDHAAFSATLVMVVGDTQMVEVNRARELAASPGTSGIAAGTPLPLSSASCRGAAVDAAHATREMLAELTRVLRPGGRLVAPVAAELPEGVRELARDETDWVAERGAGPGALVPLESARRK